MRPHVRLRVLAPCVLAIGVVTACRDGVVAQPQASPLDERAPVQTVPLRVVAERGVFGWEAAIPFTIRNEERAPLAMPACVRAYAVQLERLDAGRWTLVWRNAIPRCRSAPVTVAPGGALRDTLRFFAGYDAAQAAPVFEVPSRARGTYRLVIPATLAGEAPTTPEGVGGETGEARTLVSNAFTLELP